MDVLNSGFSGLIGRAERLGFGDRTELICCDFSSDLSLKGNSVDVVVAHFSLYTLAEPARRMQALKNFCEFLKVRGRLILVNPSKDYDAEKIIQESLASLESIQYFIAKYILYPLTLRLGLRFIESQLRSKVWHSYSLEEMVEEIQLAGFTIQTSESVYAGSGWLVVAEK